MFGFSAIHIDSNIWGNIIGSFIAVCGAIAVLFLSEWLRSKNTRNETEKNFLREIAYLQAILKECKKSVEQMIQRLSVGAQNIYFNYDPNNVLSISSQRAYQEGMLYEYLTSEQIAKYNSEVLSFFGSKPYPIDNYVRDQINGWKSGTISQQDLYQTFEWVKEKSDDALKLLKSIEKSFKKNSNR